MDPNQSSDAVILYISSHAQNSVQRAEQYILEEYENGTQFCNYGLALSTAALTVNEPEVLEVTTRAMVDDLKGRILDSSNC